MLGYKKIDFSIIFTKGNLIDCQEFVEMASGGVEQEDLAAYHSLVEITSIFFKWLLSCSDVAFASVFFVWRHLSLLLPDFPF